MTGTNTHGSHVGFTPGNPRLRAWTAPGSDLLRFSPARYVIRGPARYGPHLPPEAWFDDEPSL